MVSSKIPRRRFHTEKSDSDSDDTFEVRKEPNRRLHEYSPMGEDEAAPVPAESYEYIGCFTHDWDKSTLEYNSKSQEMTPAVSKIAPDQTTTTTMVAVCFGCIMKAVWMKIIFFITWI